MAKRGGKPASSVQTSPTQGYSRPKPQLHVPEPRSILDSKLYQKAESALQELLGGTGKYSRNSEVAHTESQTRPKPMAESGNVKETQKYASQRRSISSRQGEGDVRNIHQARGRFLRSILNPAPASIPPKPSPLPSNPTEASKEAVAASLRNQLLQRFKARDPEEPPQDLLHMTVLERTDQFLRKRSERIKEQQLSLKVKEVEECTFHPILYTQISPKDMKRPTKELLTLSFERTVKPKERNRSLSRLKTSSYSELYQRSKATTPRRKSLSGSSYYREF